MSSILARVQSPKCKAWFIVAFCSLYLAVQLFLIVRSHFVPSKHFGFWMFPETTHFHASLIRVLKDGRELKTKKGAWAVKTPIGMLRYDWRSFVTTYRLDRLEVRVRSKGSFNDTVRYFQAALNHVADRIPLDTSTHKLVLRIHYQRAGGSPQTIVLESKPRSGGKWPGTID